MSTYIASARYSNEAFKGMVAQPQDREAAARGIFEALGVQLHQLYFSVNEAEIVAIMEGEAQQMAALEMVTKGSGTFDAFSAKEVISMSDMRAAMETASKVASAYAPPNR